MTASLRETLRGFVWVALGTMVAAGVAQHEQFAAPPRANKRSDRASSQQAAAWGGVASHLRRMGHRNWIAVVDSAYPLQTAPGVTMIYVGGDQIAAVKKVLAYVDHALHVRGTIFVDKELDFVADEDARGIDAYRQRLKQLLAKRNVRKQLHEQTIKMFDAAADQFAILILKTDLTLPYTSVFVRLDCGYWSDAAEQRLRRRMNQ